MVCLAFIVLAGSSDLVANSARRGPPFMYSRARSTTRNHNAQCHFGFGQTEFSQRHIVKIEDGQGLPWSHQQKIESVLFYFL